MNPRVAILGCGPAGLLAAHAAKLSGAEVFVYSKKIKSRIHGAQYIHREIEGLSPKFALIEYIKFGTKEGYARKVYGEPDYPCSWDKFAEGKHQAWSMMDVYDFLWDKWENKIHDAEIGPTAADEIASLDFELLISTIPRPALCKDIRNHHFEAKPIWVQSDVAMPIPKDNVIIYNGDPKNTWYRYSNLFGHSFMEFAHGKDGGNGFKPVGHTCDCNPEWLKMGRFGRWERGILAHHSYEETIRAVLGLRTGNQASRLS